MLRYGHVRRRPYDYLRRQPLVCDLCGRVYVYCKSFLKHVKAHADRGQNDGYGTLRPANTPSGSAEARGDDDGDGPGASDTPTSTAAAGHVADGGPPSPTVGVSSDGTDDRDSDVMVISPDGSRDSDVIVLSSDGSEDGDGHLHADRDAGVVVISSDSDGDADGAADARDDGLCSWDAAAGRYFVPFLSDISDASDDETPGTQTVPVNPPSAPDDPCTACSECYVKSSAAAYRSIICPHRCTIVATSAKIRPDRS